MFDKSDVIAWGFMFVSFIVVIAMLLVYDAYNSKQRGVEHVMKVCEETGMYLTEGKAMSCRVLKDQRG